MLKILKEIKDAEKEARKILDEANLQVERIWQNAKRRVDVVYKESYENAIVKTENKSREIQQKRKEEAELETEEFLHLVGEQIVEIRTKTEKRMDDAIKSIMKEILS